MWDQSRWGNSDGGEASWSSSYNQWRNGKNGKKGTGNFRGPPISLNLPGGMHDSGGYGNANQYAGAASTSSPAATGSSPQLGIPRQVSQSGPTSNPTTLITDSMKSQLQALHSEPP